MPHGELFGQFDQRADVIAVVMGRPQVIDVRDAGRPERSAMRPRSRSPALPVSTSSDSPVGPTKSVDARLPCRCNESSAFPFAPVRTGRGIAMTIHQIVATARMTITCNPSTPIRTLPAVSATTRFARMAGRFREHELVGVALGLEHVRPAIVRDDPVAHLFGQGVGAEIVLAHVQPEAQRLAVGARDERLGDGPRTVRRGGRSAAARRTFPRC